MKKKHDQIRKEKTMEEQQEQEMRDGYLLRSRADCDKAFKEWVPTACRVSPDLI